MRTVAAHRSTRCSFAARCGGERHAGVHGRRACGHSRGDDGALADGAAGRYPAPRAGNVLVTGGAGFIGSALVARLLADGHRVAVLDDGSTGCAEDVDVRAVVYARDIVTGDLSGVFAAAQPEAVFHLAARTAVDESVRTPARGAAVNVCGTVNVLQRCRAFGVRRFVLASSGGALYGDAAPRPTPECRAPSPACP